MQAFASEAGLALERSRATIALADALERERLISHVSLELRSRRDVDEVLPAALEEIGIAARRGSLLHQARRQPGEPASSPSGTPTALPPLGDAEPAAGRESRGPASRAPWPSPTFSTRRRSTTAALGDVRGARRARRPRRAGDTDRRAGSAPRRARLPSRRPWVTWSPTEIALAEAVAREAAVALDTSRLLRESDRRLAEQQALLKAGRGAHERPPLRRRDRAPRRGAPRARERRRCRLLDAPSRRQRARLPRRARPARERDRPHDPGRRHDRRRDRDRQARAAARLRGDRAAAADRQLRGLRRGDGRADLLVRRDPRRARRLLARARPLRGVRPAPDRGVREPRLDRAPERGGLRGEHAADAGRARLLPDRGRAQRAAVRAGDARRGRPGRGGGARRRLGRRAPLRRRRARARGRATSSSDGLAAHLRESAVCACRLCVRGGKVLASRRLRRRRSLRRRARSGRGGGRRDARSSPSRSSSPAGRRPGSCSSSSRASARSTTTSSSWPAQVAAAARGALERSDLYERERRSRHLAQRLARAGRELARRARPGRRASTRSVRHAVQLLGGDGASVRLLEGDEVVVRAAAGPGRGGGARHAALRRPPGSSATSSRRGDARAIADVAGDPRIGEADAMLAAGYAGYLGVPMIGPEESAHGILAVYSTRPREWREEEDDALHALAATAAAARVNAELYQGVSHEQQRSEAILANVADGIVAVDRDGTVVLWNPAAERVTGVSQAEALGKTPTEALGRPLDAAGGVARRQPAAADPPRRRGGLALAQRSRHDRSGRRRRRPHLRVPRHLRRAERRADEVGLRLDRLARAADAAHLDLRLRRDPAAPGRALRRGGAVDLPPLYRVRVGAADVDRRPPPLGRAARHRRRWRSSSRRRTSAPSSARPCARPRAPTARTGTASSSSSPTSRSSAEADREKLGQVLAHLLDNAVRYSPAGGTVTVAARRREDAVEVSVEDEGVGIPHAEQERIFRKFYRGDRPRPERSARVRRASASSSPRVSSRRWVAGSGSTRAKARGRRSCSSCVAAESET